MVSETVGKNVSFCLFGGERDEGEVSVNVGFGEGEYLHLASIIVRVTHKGSKNVNGRVVSEGLTFKVESHVFSFGDEFETFLHLADDGFAVSHCHDECSLSPK